MITCVVCGIKTNNKKYCSKECFYTTLKGKNNPMFGKQHTDESKHMISISSKNRKPAMLGKTHSESAKHKISVAHRKINITYDTLYKLYWINNLTPDKIGVIYGVCGATILWNMKQLNVPRKTISEVNIGRKHTIETKKKMSTSAKGIKKSAKAIKLHADAIRGKKHTKEHKIKIGIASKMNWANLEFSQHMINTKNTIEYKDKMSLKAKETWNNPEFVAKYRATLSNKPNKAELKLYNILDEYFPDSWSYTGDFGFMINGKNPDFVNINGENKVIELFGDYWHKGENPQDRIDFFNSNEYSAIVIWEHELKDKQALVLKLLYFCGG
ncbi:MAG: NUMOD3 domain-containing DNA-binding protein [Candidatus Daviesbacteria bacterium]|nr:NUMOD3 domain-containing DNA-binding protein [Candidatus Daviesbacteria bacterium]